MASPVPMDVTQLLVAWSQGDEGALGKLVPLVYRELRRLAHRYMRKERGGHALQTTALVHEAYERLVDTPHVRWQDRTHFFAVCAQLMRRILVDYARARTLPETWSRRAPDFPGPGSREMGAVQGPGCVGRSVGCAGCDRPTQGTGGGAPIFRWFDRGGDGARAEDLAGYRVTRLESGESMAAA